MSRSSFEAEYRALSTIDYKLQWLLFLLYDLHIICSRVHALCYDNQSVLRIAANLGFHERTKHLEIDYHFV